MVRVLLLLTVFTLYVCYTYGQSACSQPNGKDGTCMSLDQCPQVLEIIKKPSKTQQDLDLLKKYHCGFNGITPKVCCPNICKTPDNQDGQCVSILSCPSLARLMEAPLLEHHELYVLQSICTSSQEYSVCCPLQAPKAAVPAANCSVMDPRFPPDPRTGCCGVDTVNRNGRESFIGAKVSARTTVDQYPWMALIEHVKEDKVNTICLAALISRRYLLTTAYCVKSDISNYGNATSVRLGEYDTNHEGPDCTFAKFGDVRCTDGMLRIGIEKNIVHPLYTGRKSGHINDIALIKLKQDAPFTDFIRPICLPSKDVTVNPSDDLTFYATGWGASRDNPTSNVKLQVDLPFVAKNQCQLAYHEYDRNLNITAGQICAGGVRGKDTCNGDTGGPLMYHNGYNYEATGITSFGPVTCGQPGVPGVYTHVYEYLPWIMSTINIDVTLGDTK